MTDEALTERESNARRAEDAARAADKAAAASSSFAGEAIHTAVAIVLRGVANDIRTGGNTPYPGEEIAEVAKGDAG